MTLHLVPPHLNPTIGKLPRIEKLPPDRRPFNILRNYVEDRLSLDETVERITKPVEDLYDQDHSDAYVDAHELLAFTWCTRNSIIAQIPYDHDAHRKLAELLDRIQHRHSPEGDNARSFAPWEGQLWKDLPLFEPGWGGSWESPTDTIDFVTARAVDLRHDTLGRLGGPTGIR